MAVREECKLQLSKSILEMKFMKRTKEKVERQLYQEEGEEYFGNQLTTRMKNESGRYIVEPSFAFCEQLRDGRVSYQGMNPEIERLMELEEKAKAAKEQPKREADVSDEQLAKRWKSSEVTTKEKKFKKKNPTVQAFYSNQKIKEYVTKGTQRKFLKPTD